MSKKVDTKVVGLDAGLPFMKFFLKSEYLHYGYWKEGLEVDVANFKQAQENYTDLLIENIPEEVKSILDVGCGTGRVSEILHEKGYAMEALSPPCKMTDYAIEKLDKKVPVYEGGFQEVEINKKYDLILFSESFQYIPIADSFSQSYKLLDVGGYMLLCDFFKTEAPGKSPLGGGHNLAKFYEAIPKHQFEIVKDLDITKEIAPTLAIVNSLTLEVIKPLWDILLQVVARKLPWVYRFLTWKFKKKIDKLENKHFRGTRNPENFEKYKSYRLILFRKIA